MSAAANSNAVASSGGMSATLQPITSGTGRLPAPPSVVDGRAWLVAATADDVAEAASFLRSATEMGLRPEQRLTDGEFATFVRLLDSYDYTRAELMLAMREVPRDPDRFGGAGVTVRDVERVIRRHRELRARLQQRVTARTRDELLVAFPELDPEAWGCVGFDERKERLYCYIPATSKIAQNAHP